MPPTFFEAGSARNVAASGSKRFEDRVEALDGLFRAADHHAVAAVESPDAAAGANVDVVHAFGGAELGAANVIFEIGVAAVDDGVARLHVCEQSLHGFFRGIAGGTMIHAARGAVSLLTRSSSEEEPTAPSPARPLTASALRSETTMV